MYQKVCSHFALALPTGRRSCHVTVPSRCWTIPWPAWTVWTTVRSLSTSSGSAPSFPSSWKRPRLPEPAPPQMNWKVGVCVVCVFSPLLTQWTCAFLITLCNCIQSWGGRVVRLVSLQTWCYGFESRLWFTLLLKIVIYGYCLSAGCRLTECQNPVITKMSHCFPA